MIIIIVIVILHWHLGMKLCAWLHGLNPSIDTSIWSSRSRGIGAVQHHDRYGYANKYSVVQCVIGGSITLVPRYVV